MTTQLIEAVKSFEGLRLKAYIDPAGIPTIGYGHTAGVRIGQTITPQQATQYLLADLRRTNQQVQRLLDLHKIDLPKHQVEALTSFAYNLGIKALKNSTLFRLIRQGAPTHTIAEQFHRWIHAAGRPLQGLIRRRAWEADHFQGRHNTQ